MNISSTALVPHGPSHVFLATRTATYIVVAVTDLGAACEAVSTLLFTSTTDIFRDRIETCLQLHGITSLIVFIYQGYVMDEADS